MRTVKSADVTFRYYRPEATKNFPTDIYFEGENISRGRVLEFEGSEGIVWDLGNHEEYGSNEFTFMVYWFAGPLSADKAKRSQTYYLKEFLGFIGWQLIEDEE